MGCDIHLYTEAKKTINDNEIWVNIDNWKYNPYYNHNNPDDERELNIVDLHGRRNYDLFSVLANVRNYSDSPFICEPKGLPDDISTITMKESERWGIDGHSHSFLTLKELIDFQNLNHKIKHSGLVSQKEAENLDAGISTPTTWCQGASPELNLVYREWEEEYDVLNPLIEKLKNRLKEEFWIFRDDVDITEYLEKIRIVFWFDN